MTRLTVALDDRPYPILVGQGALAELPAIVKELQPKGVAALVSDTNVDPLYGDRVEAAISEAGLSVVRCVLPAGEENKRLTNIEVLCGRFLEGGLDRASIVVALGGGVVGDMAGYASASFMRGVRHVQVPTTIVAQVDSSVGGKTAVNHPLGKNTIGAFHQPSAVVADLTLLETLPDRELRAGMAEVIKHGAIADEALFEYLESHCDAICAKDLEAIEYPVVRSCEIKSAIVAEDEREHGVRANLNYGHTFGHGIETVSRYEKYLHGEAVALGMRAAGALARDLGLVDDDFVARQDRCIDVYGLPTTWPELPVDDTLVAMRRDKKVRAGTMKFVVADRMGHVVHRTDITEGQARAALEALATC
ncbi:MAG: 3-dehydroquinate synthase [bacterium]|nr:3-dehydroquinate synthase [bacterium]